MNKRNVKSIVIVLAITMAGGIFLGTYLLSQQPMPEAIEALTSDDRVTVNRVFVQSWLNHYYAFEPAGEKPLLLVILLHRVTGQSLFPCPFILQFWGMRVRRP